MSRRHPYGGRSHGARRHEQPRADSSSSGPPEGQHGQQGGDQAAAAGKGGSPGTHAGHAPGGSKSGGQATARSRRRRRGGGRGEHAQQRPGSAHAVRPADVIAPIVALSAIEGLTAAPAEADGSGGGPVTVADDRDASRVDRDGDLVGRDATGRATAEDVGPAEDGSTATAPSQPAEAIDAAADRREAGSVGSPAPTGGCTLSQLRRFVKSRPYVPLHELRRRFALNGSEDDVVPLEAGGGRLYVGLPEREARLLEELLRHGEVGYECSLDPPSPIIVGVYPMRPVPRP